MSGRQKASRKKLEQRDVMRRGELDFEKTNNESLRTELATERAAHARTKQLSDGRMVWWELFVEYARRLRFAWLNPSHKPAQLAVHEFEREHAVELETFWTLWQKQ